VNRLIKFSSVSEGNFASVLRRALVWKPEARFVDAGALKDYPDHEQDGVFPKDCSVRTCDEIEESWSAM
jgi:hypothetical protein